MWGFPLVGLVALLLSAAGATAAETSVVLRCTIAPRAVLSFGGEFAEEISLPAVEFAGDDVVLTVLSNVPWTLYIVATGVGATVPLWINGETFSIGSVPRPAILGQRGVYRLSLHLPFGIPSGARLLFALRPYPSTSDTSLGYVLRERAS